MTENPVDLEELLLATLAADDSRRRAALRVLRGQSVAATATQDATGPVLMRMGEAARYLGISRTTLWRLVREGLLDQVAIRRGSYRLRKSDLDQLVANRGRKHERGERKASPLD